MENSVEYADAQVLVALLADEDKEVRHYAAHGLDLLKWTPADDRERELLEAAKQW